MKSFSWSAPEYSHTEKSQDWFWVLGIGAAAIAITAIIFGNILFALLVAIGAFVIALFAARKPHIIDINITEKGITIDKEQYPLKNILSYWIDDEHRDGPRLILRSNKLITPYIIAPMFVEDIAELEVFFKGRIKKEEYQDHPVHDFFERMGF